MCTGRTGLDTVRERIPFARVDRSAAGFGRTGSDPPAQAYYRALESRDPARLDEILADDVVWTPPQSAPLDGPFHGRDYANEYVWVFTCAGGRIVRMDEHNDSLLLHQVLLAS
jgi:ketosteroid isomerase-like protein